MTDLTQDQHRRVKRRVLTTSHTPLVVTLSPEGIWLREPRRRVAYLMPYGQAFVDAVRLHVAAEKRRKTAEKKARRTI